MINEPLGMPSGSVRAVIGLVMVFSLIYLLATKCEIPEAFWGLVGSVIGYYFASRVSEKSNAKTLDLK